MVSLLRYESHIEMTVKIFTLTTVLRPTRKTVQDQMIGVYSGTSIYQSDRFWPRGPHAGCEGFILPFYGQEKTCSGLSPCSPLSHVSVSFLHNSPGSCVLLPGCLVQFFTSLSFFLPSPFSPRLLSVFLSTCLFSVFPPLLSLPFSPLPFFPLLFSPLPFSPVLRSALQGPHNVYLSLVAERAFQDS